MNLDDLRREWAARDNALVENLRINNRLLRENWIAQNMGDIRVKGWLAQVELLLWLPCIALMGWFNAQHWGQWAFFIPGVLLQAWFTLMPVLSIRQRIALQSVDYSQPVLALQREIETLKMRRMFTLKWAFLIGQVIWYIPFLIVFFKGVFGVNLYLKGRWVEDFMLINVACGIAFIPLAVWASRVFAPKLEGKPWFQKFTDNLAGRDMMAAREFLERLARFERDTGADERLMKG